MRPLCDQELRSTRNASPTMNHSKPVDLVRAERPHQRVGERRPGQQEEAEQREPPLVVGALEQVAEDPDEEQRQPRRDQREQDGDATHGAQPMGSGGLVVGCRRLPDLVVEAEDRQVHRDHDEADDAADQDDHHRLDQRGERLDLGVDLGLVEVGDLARASSRAGPTPRRRRPCARPSAGRSSCSLDRLGDRAARA